MRGRRGHPSANGNFAHHGAIHNADKHLALVAIELTEAGVLGRDALSLIVARLKIRVSARLAWARA